MTLTPRSASYYRGDAVIVTALTSASENIAEDTDWAAAEKVHNTICSKHVKLYMKGFKKKLVGYSSL